MKDEKSPVYAKLSPRERQILSMVRDEKTSAQIAHTLQITEGTVKNHLTNASEKLGTQSRLGSVIIAIKSGLIPLEKGMEPFPDGPTLLKLISKSRAKMEKEFDELVNQVSRMRIRRIRMRQSRTRKDD